MDPNEPQHINLSDVSDIGSHVSDISDVWVGDPKSVRVSEKAKKYNLVHRRILRGKNANPLA